MFRALELPRTLFAHEPDIMCGIAGILALDGSPDRVTRARLGAMASALAHRGPDGDGYLVDPDGPLGLAHRRLAIVDPAGGRQPIANEDRSVHVVLNGEIFNHVELRRELRSRGHRFDTGTDTEVLVHLYEECGEELVHALNGQFAFALWDAGRRRLVLARDRPGISPLYYWQGPSELVFASEVKALLAVIPRPGVNPRAIRQVFQCWAPLSPETAFAGVLEVEPGQLVIATAEGLTRRRYWEWSLPPAGEERTGAEPELAEELQALLDDATRLRLRADVPVGACLSGGLDSSLLAALAARATDGGALRTFSIRFADRDLDETPFQRTMVDRLGTAHAEVTVDRAGVAEALPAVIRAAETPLLRAAPAPVARLASRIHAAGVKVVLTGEGADEVFGGYDLFREAKVRAFCARQRDSRLRPLLLKRLYPYLTFTRDQTPAVLKSYFAALDDDTARPAFSHRLRFAAGLRCEAFLDPQFREQIDGFDPEARLAADLEAGLRGRSVIQRAQLLEARTLLAGYLLSSQGDRMLMAHSVEGRYPYLDHRVIEFGNALAPQLKVRVLREKHLLKRCAQGLVPDAIRERPKQPYRAPDAVAFVGPGRPTWVADALGGAAIRRAGYFDATRVNRLIRKLETAVARGEPISHVDSQAFMAVLSTQLWHGFFQGGR